MRPKSWRGRSLTVVLSAFALVGALCGSASAQTTLATIDVGIRSTGDPLGNIVFNPTTNRVYAFGWVDSVPSVGILEVATGELTIVRMPDDFANFWQPTSQDLADNIQYVAVNPSTNRIYILGTLRDGSNVVVVMDGATNGMTLVYLSGDPLDRYKVRSSGGIAVNPITNHVYVIVNDNPNDSSNPNPNNRVAVIDGATNTLTLSSQIPLWFDPIYGIYSTRYFGTTGGIAVNPNTSRIHIPGGDGTARYYMAVLDETTGEFSLLPSPTVSPDLPFQSRWQVAVDSSTNRIFVAGSDRTNGQHVAVLDGATDGVSLMIDVPTFTTATHPGSWFPTGLAVNPSTNRLYMTGRDGIAIVDLPTGIVRLALRESFTPGWNLTPAIDPATNRLYSLAYWDGGVIVVDLGSSAVTTGSNVVVQADSASIAFDTVISAGSISVTPISDPATAGQVPGGFAISDLVAYEVSPSPSLIFAGTATTCFQMSGIDDSAAFANLRVLHMESGALVDRTSSQEFSTRTLCATTTSFSPFYVARAGNRVKALFDQSRTYRAGSTIPIRVQMLNQAGANISSPALVLTARRLTSMENGTAVSVNDAGHANPSSAFRYDPMLAGYIFNLSTKGLMAGRYCLSFWTAADRAFLYDVVFEVR